jgi:transaldolase
MSHPANPIASILSQWTTVMNALESLIATGTKLWLDSVDPDLIAANKTLGATGATSNPIIIHDLIRSGRFDAEIEPMVYEGLESASIAWRMTDLLVRRAQNQFHDVWIRTRGNDGYVSFELDSLIEDPGVNLDHDVRVGRYIDEGVQWSTGHQNRMIKVPATPAGIDALEELAANGVPLNVTLIFTRRQYEAARDAIWRGAQRRDSLDTFKSVYSIFVSRIDTYTEQHWPQLSHAAQGMVGIVNAKRIWALNNAFWGSRNAPLDQEIVFASTGTKKVNDDPWKYVEALAGSDIQTNPPATNEAVLNSGRTFGRTVDVLPGQSILDEIDSIVDFEHLEATLMREGIDKFVAPQVSLQLLVDTKRLQIVGY